MWRNYRLMILYLPRPNFQTNKSALPATTRPAPIHAPRAGTSLVLIQSMGSNMAGEVAVMVEIMPTSPPSSANRNKVMPMPMPLTPARTVMPNNLGVSGLARLKALIGSCTMMLSISADVPTLKADAATGSTPVSITGRARMEPMAWQRAANTPSDTPIQMGPLMASH